MSAPAAASARAVAAVHPPAAAPAAACPVPLIGLHMPRCGGTSLLAMFEAALPRELVHQSTSLHRNWAEARPAFPEIPRPGRLRLVFGHWVHEEMLHLLPDALLFTALRAPEARLASHYRFTARLCARQGRPVPAPASWLDWQGPNPMCRFVIRRFPTLAGTGTDFERARRALGCFDAVLFPETLATAGAALAGRAGLDTAPGHENAAPGDDAGLPLQRIELADDRRLVDWARDAFPGPEGRRAGPPPPDRAAFLAQQPRPDRLSRFVYAAERAELAAFGVLAAAREDAARTAHASGLRARILAGDGAPALRRGGGPARVLRQLAGRLHRR